MFGIQIKISKFNKLVYSYQLIFVSSLVLIPILISVSFGKYQWVIYQILLYFSLALGLNLKSKNNTDNRQILFPKKENRILKIFYFLLIGFIFIQIFQSLFYLYAAQSISPATKYILFDNPTNGTNIWRYFSFFLAFKNSIFFFLTYIFTINNLRFGKFKKSFLFFYLIISALYIIYIDGLSMLGYTWPIFFSLVFVKPRSIISKFKSRKLNYTILTFVLIIPLILFVENVIGNKLIEIGAYPGLTIIDFDPKEIIDERSNLIVNIFAKTQLTSIIYYYGIEMFNSAKLITSMDGFCFYFLIPISKISNLLSKTDVCESMQKILFDSKLLGAWTMFGTVIGSKLSFLGVILYGLIFGNLLSKIINFTVKFESYLGLKDDPIGFTQLIQISSISTMIINPDIVAYIAIVSCGAFVSMLSLIKLKNFR